MGTAIGIILAGVRPPEEVRLVFYPPNDAKGKHGMISDELVKKIASLSHLHLEEGDSKELTKKLSAILSYIDRLKEVEVSGIEPMSHVHGSTNIMREDKLEPSMPIDSLLQNVPDHSGRFIRVPLVVE